MKKAVKKQIILLSINIFIILALFLSLFVYDNFIREPYVVYRRPLVPMEKRFTRSNPLFEYFDRIDLFSRYKGTRAVGSEIPENMVLLVAHPSYEQNFHFSHLLYEAYREKCGLVVMDFKDIRNFIPIEDESGRVRNMEERNNLFIRTMMEYMEQYGFTRFRLVYLGGIPDQNILSSFPSLVYSVPRVPVILKEVLTMEEETRIIRDIFNFSGE